MQSKAENPESYISELPTDRQAVMQEMRHIICKNLPPGFQEGMGYGMLGYSVPHSKYPAGYHCDPKQPLPFLGVASQKNHISFYHMGIYADQNLMDWFIGEWPKHSSKKLDMGKSCIRFKKPEDVTLELIGQLCQKMTPDDWIACYEKAFRKK